ncbi:MAG: hemolysin family protein, partial [Pyrinomonadaceae bacterium]
MLTIFKLISVVLLVLANGFFVASEFALVGVRRSRIVAQAASGNTRAQRLVGMLDNLSAYVSATQLGITLASLALGWIGEPALAHLIEPPLETLGATFNQAPGTGFFSEGVRHTIAFGIAFTLITFMHIVIGELAPKTLALERAERIALLIAWPLQIFYRIFSWPIRFLDWAGTRSVLLLGLKPSSEHGASYTEQELRLLIEASHKSGHLEASERQLIDRVFDFSQTEVHEAMVPRTAVKSLPVSASLEEVVKAFTTSGYSRLPVYRERLDEVEGILFIKDLVPYLNDRTKEFKIEKLLHRAIYIPESAKLGAVLKQMQEGRSHLAFVVDEHGG